jgi:hypothetical protein
MKNAADRVPEDLLVTGEAWRLIMLEILKICKPYLDVETEVLIEETLFTTQKDHKETMTSYLTRKMHKRRDLVSALGHRKMTCSQCMHCTDEPVDLPERIWTYLLKRDARLTEDQRKVIHNWDSGTLGQDRLLELLLRLDRPDALVAQALAASGSKATYFGQDTSSEPPAPSVPVVATVQGLGQSALQAMLQSGPVQENEEAREDDDVEDVEE